MAGIYVKIVKGDEYGDVGRQDAQSTCISVEEA